MIGEEKRRNQERCIQLSEERGTEVGASSLEAEECVIEFLQLEGLVLKESGCVE